MIATLVTSENWQKNRKKMREIEGKQGFFFFFFFFFFSFLWCNWSGNQPLGDLARSGYILDMKAEKNRILLHFWLPTGKKFFGNLANLGHFIHGKSFLWVEIIFYRAKFRQRKKHWGAGTTTPASHTWKDVALKTMKLIWKNNFTTSFLSLILVPVLRNG